MDTDSDASSVDEVYPDGVACRVVEEESSSLDFSIHVEIEKKDIDRSRQVTVIWRDLDLHVPIFNPNPSFKEKLRKTNPCTGTAPSGRRQILYQCKGLVIPGEVMALMGPSGSGKTSLVSVIGGRTPPGATQRGEVLFNGQPLTRRVKKHVGYVLQDDRLFDSLTVYETLYYAARLRLPRSMSRHDKEKRVEAVIDALGLGKCRGTLIGGPMRRGVSGGERKRVSVGHELLIDPSVLILDEPTSGLDSTTAMNLLSTLRTLAREGRTVVTTIHQPSSRLYRQLDKLILMCDGHMMYSGRGDRVADWFSAIGCKLPYGVNVADFILDLSSGTFEDAAPVLGATGNDRKGKLIEVSEQFLKEYEDGFLGQEDVPHIGALRKHENAHFDSGDETLPARASAAAFAPRRLQAVAGAKGLSAVEDRESGASWMEQFSVLAVRCGRTRRFEALGLQRFISFCGVATVAGLFWWQRGDENDLAAALDMSSLLFFETVFMSFALMFAALFTFPTEIGMILKERASGMYNLSAYYLARTLSSLPLDMLYPFFFTLIVYWSSGLRPQIQWYLANFGAISLGVLVSQSIGLILGAWFVNLQKAQTTCTILILTFMLVSGFWVKHVPEFLSWVKYTSFVYWTYSLLLKIEFHGRTYVDCGTTDSDPLNNLEQPYCPDATDVDQTLRFPRPVDETPLLDVGVLIVLLIFLRFATYAVLWRKTRKA